MRTAFYPCTVVMNRAETISSDRDLVELIREQCGKDVALVVERRIQEAPCLDGEQLETLRDILRNLADATDDLDYFIRENRVEN